MFLAMTEAVACFARVRGVVFGTEAILARPGNYVGHAEATIDDALDALLRWAEAVGVAGLPRIDVLTDYAPERIEEKRRIGAELGEALDRVVGRMIRGATSPRLAAQASIVAREMGLVAAVLRRWGDWDAMREVVGAEVLVGEAGAWCELWACATGLCERVSERTVARLQARVEAGDDVASLFIGVDAIAGDRVAAYFAARGLLRGGAS